MCGLSSRFRVARVSDSGGGTKQRLVKQSQQQRPASHYKALICTLTLLCAALAISLGLVVAGHTQAPTCDDPPQVLRLSSSPAFSVLVVGAGGGLVEADLSGYLFGPLDALGHSSGSNSFAHAYAAMDAGALLNGLVTMEARGVLDELSVGTSTLSKAGYLLLELVQSVCVGHAHMDHMAGFVISSPAFNNPSGLRKRVFGRPVVLQILQDSIFNWRVWANMGDGGIDPLGMFEFHATEDDVQVQIADGVAMRLFPVVHGAFNDGSPYPSTAFLVTNSRRKLHCLYFSDVGPDSIQGTNKTAVVWQRVAPLVFSGSLRAIFLECSFVSTTPDELLFGHLTPCYLIQELRVLANFVAGYGAKTAAEALVGLQIIVTHVKPDMQDLSGATNRQAILNELLSPVISNPFGTCHETNDLDVQFHMAKQAMHLHV